jgi:hypothetical protein
MLLVAALATAWTRPMFAQPKLAPPHGKDFEDDFDPELQKSMERDPQFRRWAYFANLNTPQGAEGAAPAYFQLEVTPEVIDRSQLQLNDLRLANAKGERIPYVLQTLNSERRQTDVAIVQRFNAGEDAKSGAYQESVELGAVGAPGHNEISIRTTGTNFRRRVKIEGANDEGFKNALSLLPTDSFVYRFETPDGKITESSMLRYDYKQFRFLRVHVLPDANNRNDSPKIESLAVRQTIVREGEEVTRPLNKGLSERQATAASGGPGSAWYIDLGQFDFVHKLTLRSSKAVDRTIQLKVAERGQPSFDLHGLDASWHKEREGDFRLVLRFPEVRARRFRLVVTDFANEPLNLAAESYGSYKRRLIFENPAHHPQPLKLYFGNQESSPARYDLEKTLPVKLDPTPPAATLDAVQDNPSYEKPQPPFHERNKGAVYAVLTAASLVLVGLLVSLSRQIKPTTASLFGDVGKAQ